ncbi:23 kDa integral membrane protein-like [Paramacrobiotus metropolitanus]|uniref:23 kDa integral membrane protein-like n=1 Tax=Paramacrobiotus metropolitanus TaxID=2943436 RepID=UPI0024456BE9|nr:23 kDa integral membrane protein-like [Paramacrobiotus metropolitanus]
MGHSNINRGLKYCVAIFFATSMIIGVGLGGGAIYVKHRFAGGTEVGWTVWVAILCGGTLVLVGIIGIAAVKLDSLLILVVATTCLAVVCAAFVGFTIYAQVELNNAGREVGQVLKLAMQHYDPSDKQTTLDLDIYQKQLYCCGADGPEDWLTTPYRKLPNSCKGPPPRTLGCTQVISSYVKNTASYALRALAALTGYHCVGLVLCSALTYVCYRKGL